MPELDEFICIIPFLAGAACHNVPIILDVNHSGHRGTLVNPIMFYIVSSNSFNTHSCESAKTLAFGNGSYKLDGIFFSQSEVSFVFFLSFRNTQWQRSKREKNVMNIDFYIYI